MIRLLSALGNARPRQAVGTCAHPEASDLAPHPTARIAQSFRPRRVPFEILLLVLSFLPFLVLFLLTMARGNTEVFPNLIPNPSFESDADRDGLPDLWRREPAEGTAATLETDVQSPDGTLRSIALQGKGTWSCVVSGLTPGRTYLLSLWVRRDGWRDGEYPTLRIFDQDLYLNELYSFGGWVRLSRLLTAPSGRETTLSLVNPGLTHRIRFDSLCLSEFQIFLRSPQEGARVDTTHPVFFWSLPEDGRVYDLSLEVSRSRDFKDPVRLETVSPWGTTARLAQPLEDGAWFWRVQAFYHRRLLATSPVQSFRINTPRAQRSAHQAQSLAPRVGTTERRSEMSGYGVKASGAGPEASAGTHEQRGSSIPHPASRIPQPSPDAQRLTPQAFFPLGLYAADPAAFARISESGFTCVQSYATDLATVEDVVRRAEQHGLKAMVRLPRGASTRETSEFLNRMRSSPALLAWYLEDEPEGRSVPPAYLWRVREYVRSHDAEHPAALVVLRSHTAVDYAKAVDIMMVDPYPVPQMPMTWLADSIDEARWAVFDEKPVWAVIQAFSWADSPCRDETRAWGRLPTYEEERCLSYLAVVHGARGLYYFSFPALQKDPAHWRNVETVVKELAQLAPLLLAASDPTQGGCERTAAGAVHYLSRDVPPQLVVDPGGTIRAGGYLIAVNTTGAPVRASLTVPAGGGDEAEVLFERRRVFASSGAINDEFGPYGVHVYALSPRQTGE